MILQEPECRHRHACLIVPKVLASILVPNQSLSPFVYLHTAIFVRRSNCTPFPVTTVRITSMSLTSDHNIQVLMTSKHFQCSRLKQAIHALGYTLNQLNVLFLTDFGCFLSDKRDLGLRCREKLFDIIDKQDDAFDEVFEL